jgi:hypothetical protein
LFSFERKENNNHKPYGYKTILWELLHLIILLCFCLASGRISFSFLPSQQKRKKSPLRTLRLERIRPEADKAGGEKHALTYLQSKTGTISIAEGLMHLL